MAGKLKFISELANHTAQEVTQDVESWKRYLRTASRLYRYDFADQLLIYAQRPDATACAPLELWNEKMGRWVKAGAKGIALIHKWKNGWEHLDHVFDVSDTRPLEGAKDPYLWKMREEYHTPVMEALEKRYGQTGEQDFGECLKEIVKNIVVESYADYLQDLEYDSEGSPLENAEISEWEEYFRQTMETSVQYAVLTRCGFDPEKYLEKWALEGITLFSTPATLYHLGDACSRITMEICTEIRREIRRQEREKENERKNIEKPLDKPLDMVYSEDAREFSTVKRESIEKGGNEYARTGVQERGGLSGAGSGDGRSGGSGNDADREVRPAAEEFSDGSPSRDVHVNAVVGEAGQTSAGSGQSRTGAGGRDAGADDESGRSGREVESTGSDTVGAENKQPDRTGGGDDTAGSGLHLISEQEAEDTEEIKENTEREETAGEDPAVFMSSDAEETPLSEKTSVQLSLFPTVEEQVEKIAQVQREEKRAELIPGQRVKNLPEGLDRCMNSALASGGNDEDGILRIIAFYQKDPTNEAAAEFLKKEFGVGGKGILVDGAKVSVWFNQDGIFFAQGNSALVPGAVLVPWKRAAARVRKLLEKGVFATQDKLDGAREFEYHRQAQDMCFLAGNISDKAREKGYLPYLMELYKGFSDNVEKIAELLHEAGNRFVFCAELDTFIQALQKDPELLKYKTHRPETIRAEIASLGISPKQFHCTEGFEPVKGSFITEDEIAHMLRSGGNMANGKFRIYACFMQGHSANECEEFLRDEYRTGGFKTFGYDVWHDSKGIKFTRADEYSGSGGYDTVFFSWKQVQERIRKLIDKGQYLSTKEREYLPEYEKMQLAEALYDFHSLDPNKPENSELLLWDQKKWTDAIKPFLDNPQLSAALYEDMVKTFALLVPEDVRGYEVMQKALEDMAAYQRGEYSLFTPLPAARLEAERAGVRRQKENRRESRQPEKRTAKNEASEDKPVVKKLSEMAAARNPEGELEKAARALAKKQRAKAGTKQEIDGQLSFDFTAMGTMGTGSGETENPVEEAEQPENSVDEAEQPEEKSEESAENEAEAAESEAEAEETGFVPNVEEYLNLKARYPDKLIMVPVYGLYILYGKDAEIASQALGTKALRRKVEGLGETFVTGAVSWQAMMKRLLERGNSVLVAGLEPGKGENAPYTILKEQNASEYIPLGERVTVNGRRMEVDRVDFEHGTVSLRDLEMQGELPVFREEFISFVRGCIEEEASYWEGVIGSSVEKVIEATEMAGESAEAVRSVYDADLEEAKELIEKCCLGKYGQGYADFSDLEHIEIAHNTIIGTGYECKVRAEADLKNYSIAQFLEGECVNRRQYRSLREMINRELKWLHSPSLVYVRKSVLSEWESRNATKESPIPQQSLVPSDMMQVYDIGLPFEVVTQKLVTVEQREAERRQRERRDYRITEDNLGAWGQKTRCQYNIAAIRTLKQIEEEKRDATAEEQEILSKYTGWGGVSQVFDPAKAKWEKEYAELKELLTPEEYESARATVLNAFYTSPLVIKAIYAAIGRMNYTPGNVLEPSCGSGNFFGLVPETFRESRLYGVELDSLTGRIAAQLYQKADITVGGFETVEYPDDFFDLALGNIPFGDYKVHDRNYDKLNLNIHDYFLVKSLDKIRPGGIMAFVTSKGTMDKADRRAREALAQKADLLGAVRLPNTAFKDNADTDVTSDILFFQKRGSAPEK